MYLIEILRDTILSIGEDIVFQVVIDKASNCVHVEKLLMEHLAKLFWTHYAIYCIDVTFHDIGKIDWVKENISQARQIVKFILNH